MDEKLIYEKEIGEAFKKEMFPDVTNVAGTMHRPELLFRPILWRCELYHPHSSVNLSDSRFAADLRHVRHILKSAISKLRGLHKSRSPLIDSSILIEEKLISNYNARKYYPIRISEIGGHGSSSTVWLCRDLL
jgi:hypothetical protein